MQQHPLFRVTAHTGTMKDVMLAGGAPPTAESNRGCRQGGVNWQAIARAIDLHKSQEQRQNLSRS